MKISIDKSRVAISVLIIALFLVTLGFVLLVLQQQRQLSILRVRLHTLPVHPIAFMKPTVTPTATPTAMLKLNTKTGVVK